MVHQNDNVVQVQHKTVQPNDEGDDEWVNIQKLEYEVIRRIEFNSDRKRMSILVKDKQDGLYKLYIKGADNIIFERLDLEKNDPIYIQETKNFLYKASS